MAVWLKDFHKECTERLVRPPSRQTSDVQRKWKNYWEMNECFNMQACMCLCESRSRGVARTRKQFSKKTVCRISCVCCGFITTEVIMCAHQTLWKQMDHNVLIFFSSTGLLVSLFVNLFWRFWPTLACGCDNLYLFESHILWHASCPKPLY